MAQSAATELPLVHPEAPAQTTTSITTVHRNPITSPNEVPINVFLPFNLDLPIPVSGPAVMPVKNTPSDFSPDSLTHPGNATNVATDDEDDILLVMAMTFNNLYQGLTEDDEPALTKANGEDVPAPNNKDTTDFGPLFMKDDDP